MVIPGLEIDVDNGVPVYRQIAEGIRAAVAAGRLEPGRRLPATRHLALELGVNRNTVVAAYDHLASQGFVQSHTGRGTFVVSPASPTAPPELGDETWFSSFSRAVGGAGLGGLQSIYRLMLDTEGISLVGSYPTPELMPAEAFSRAMQAALRAAGPDVLGYGPTAGHLPLRRTIANAMRKNGSPVGATNLLITNGAQQALELVFRSFVDPGDAVVIEEPTYSGALSVLSTLGARVVGVPLDDEGIRPDLLAVALERHRPRLLYVQPTFHNPTTRVMSQARRRELLDLTARHRCPVVEDDWAGDLRFEGDDLPTLHALDGGRHVIYLSTFSKKLMPGLRIGWVAAPTPVLERLVELKRVQDCGTSPLLQAALDRFIRDGELKRHLERVRPAYRERRDRMMQALERHFPAEARFSRPSGGLFVWVVLPSGFDGQELFAAGRRSGVLYSRGELFHSDGGGRNALRIAYSAAPPEQIERGIETLGAWVKERLERATPESRDAIEAMPIL
jgi:GntR family transcriptional regulator/MocR family aminotransferase